MERRRTGCHASHREYDDWSYIAPPEAYERTDNGYEAQQSHFLCKTVTADGVVDIRDCVQIILDTHEFDGVEQLLEILNDSAVSAPHA